MAIVDQNNRSNQDQSEFEHTEPFGWGAFSFGIIFGVLLVYFVAVRPSKENISTLELRVSRLDRTLKELVDIKGSVGTTNDLLSSLKNQAELTQHATESLKQSKLLNERIVSAASRTNQAHMSLSRLTRLNDEIQRHSDKVDGSLNALSALGHVQDTLIHQDGLTSASLAALTNVDILRTKVLDMQQQLTEAEVALDRMSSLHSRMTNEYDSALNAESTANQWMNMQDQLLIVGTDIPAASRALTDLVRLKDKTLLHAEEARQADFVLDNILEMPADLLEYAADQDLAMASHTLQSMIKVLDKTLEQANTARHADLVLDNMLQLHQDLAEAEPQSKAARMVANHMMMIEADLIAQAGDTDEAYCNLHDLLSIRDRLDSESGQLERASSTLHELVKIKDDLLLEVPAVAAEPKGNSFSLINVIKDAVVDLGWLVPVSLDEVQNFAQQLLPSNRETTVAERQELDQPATR